MPAGIESAIRNGMIRFWGRSGNAWRVVLAVVLVFVLVLTVVSRIWELNSFFFFSCSACTGLGD